MIVLIIITCFILYKTGLIEIFLNKFRLEPETVTAAEPIQQHQEEPTEREKLEKQAHYILTSQSYEYPETVQYMSETMLIQIINNYCKP